LIDFDDIWQKYSKYSRTEFACFDFHVGLLFYQLFVIKTDIENNVNFENYASHCLFSKKDKILIKSLYECKG